MHGKTKESPVAEHFNGEGHTLANLTVVAIYKNIQPRLTSPQDTGKQVDQDPGDVISFGNEPQGALPVKLAQ